MNIIKRISDMHVCICAFIYIWLQCKLTFSVARLNNKHCVINRQVCSKQPRGQLGWVDTSINCKLIVHVVWHEVSLKKCSLPLSPISKLCQMLFAHSFRPIGCQRFYLCVRVCVACVCACVWLCGLCRRLVRCREFRSPFWPCGTCSY